MDLSAGSYVISCLVKCVQKHFLLMLIQQKDNSGLTYPPPDVVKVSKVAENVFEQYVDIRNSSKFLRSLMKARVMKELLSKNIFNILHEYDIEMHHPLEQFHSTQVSKQLLKNILTCGCFDMDKMSRKYQKE